MKDDSCCGTERDSTHGAENWSVLHGIISRTREVEQWKALMDLPFCDIQVVAKTVEPVPMRRPL